MAGIFLSYSREDRASAEDFARLLEQAGHEVWWDQHIDGGSEFAGEIEAALDRSDVVLVAWSKESIKSRWVRDEASVGGDTGRLVPVTIDGSLPPMGFRQFHTLDLTGWSGGRRDPRAGQLLQAIERRLKDRSGDKAAASEPAAPAQRKGTSAFRRRPALWAIAVALMLLVAAGAFLFLNGRDRTVGSASKPTIALLPFTAAASDGQLAELASEARDSLAHTLSQSGIPVRLLGSRPPDTRSAGDFLLSGELSKNADRVVATIHLDEAAHGVTVYSQRFEARPEEIQDFPDRIGAQIAGMLSDGSTLLALDRRHPVDPTLLTEILASQNSDQLQGYQNAKRVVAKAPDVPSAQIAVAFLTGFVLADLPRDDRPRALAEARSAYDRGLELAPDFGDTYAAWCLLHSEARRLECEDHLRAGIRVDPDAAYLRAFQAALLRSVGRFDEALELTRLSYTHDPYNSIKIADMLRMLEASGASDDARETYKNGVRWYPELKFYFFRARVFGLILRQDFNAMVAVEKEVGPDLPPNYTRSAAMAAAVKSKSIPELRRICSEAEVFILNTRCMAAFSAVGDLNDAYAIIDKGYTRRVGGTPAETERIWLDNPETPPPEFIASPAAASLRRDPRYLAVAQRVGLLDYWRSGRPPDFCRKHPEPVCRHLLNRR